MKISFYGKEYETSEIDYIRICTKKGANTIYFYEISVNGKAYAVEESRTIDELIIANKFNVMVRTLKDKGNFIESPYNAIMNLDKAKNIEYYENFSLLGKRTYLKIEMAQDAKFDTKKMRNPKEYEKIFNDFHKRKNDELKKHIDAIVNKNDDAELTL